MSSKFVRGDSDPVCTGLSRRKVMTQVTAGALLGVTFVIPREWTTPLVKSVVLPAHAVTSEVPPVASCSVSWGVEGLFEVGEDNDLDPPVEVTVTNTGDISISPLPGDQYFELTLEGVNLLGLATFSLVAPGALAPGESFTILIGSFAIEECIDTNATARFNFVQTSCTASIPVTCAEPAG